MTGKHRAPATTCGWVRRTVVVGVTAGALLAASGATAWADDGDSDPGDVDGGVTIGYSVPGTPSTPTDPGPGNSQFWFQANPGASYSGPSSPPTAPAPTGPAKCSLAKKLEDAWSKKFGQDEVAVRVLIGHQHNLGYLGYLTGQSQALQKQIDALYSQITFDEVQTAAAGNLINGCSPG